VAGGRAQNIPEKKISKTNKGTKYNKEKKYTDSTIKCKS